MSTAAPDGDDLRDTLTDTLIEVITEQAGEQARDLVLAALRGAAANSDSTGESLAEQLGRLPVTDVVEIVRALSFFALLANVSDDVEGDEAAASQPDPLDEVADAARKAGVSAETARSRLAGLLVSPTIAAHPTQLRRRSVFETQAAIGATLRILDRTRLSDSERQAALAKLKRQVLGLWDTALARLSQLAVSDEIAAGLRYYNSSFFKAVPIVNRQAKRALHGVWPELEIGAVVQMGSWIGGDRDGNPNATAASLELAARRNSEAALEHHLKLLHRLERELSVSDRIVRKTPGPLSQLADRSGDSSPLRADEPYRRAVRGMRARLSATAARLTGRDLPSEVEQASHGYASPEELADELAVVDESLRRSGAGDLAGGVLEKARESVAAFGFHLCGLDLRQDAAVHERTLAELFQWSGVHSNYPGVSEGEKVALLAGELQTRRPLLSYGAKLSASARTELDVFEAAARVIKQLGPRAIPNYVISMAKRPSDILEVVVLLKEVGLFTPGAEPQLQIGVTPLFETIDDLATAAAVLDDVLAIPLYRESVRARGDVQEVMVGYPHANKDGGYLSATWAVYRAEANLVSATARHGVRLRLFHGGSGGVGRAGELGCAAVAAQPHGAIQGSLRMTEQGEEVASKYADPSVARRSLAHLVAAVVRASVVAKDPLGDDAKRAHTVMDQLSTLARGAYNDLLRDTEGFADYFRAATPVGEIAALGAGSRPAADDTGDFLADVRSIPWVLAWTQSRVLLPGWYGAGTAFEQWVEEHPERMDELKDLHRRWPFFRNLVADMAASLAQADMGIAGRYSLLVADEKLRTRVFGRIQGEFKRSSALCLQITGAKTLAEACPDWPARTRERLPFVAPLNLAQIEMLGRLRGPSAPAEPQRSETRSATGEEDALRRGILITMSGLTAALRSLG